MCHKGVDVVARSGGAWFKPDHYSEAPPLAGVAQMADAAALGAAEAPKPSKGTGGDAGSSPATGTKKGRGR